jgi:hypothetical protein
MTSIGVTDRTGAYTAAPRPMTGSAAPSGSCAPAACPTPSSRPADSTTTARTSTGSSFSRATRARPETPETAPSRDAKLPRFWCAASARSRRCGRHSGSSPRRSVARHPRRAVRPVRDRLARRAGRRARCGPNQPLKEEPQRVRDDLPGLDRARRSGSCARKHRAANAELRACGTLDLETPAILVASCGRCMAGSGFLRSDRPEGR